MLPIKVYIRKYLPESKTFLGNCIKIEKKTSDFVFNVIFLILLEMGILLKNFISFSYLKTTSVKWMPLLC